MAHPSLNSAGVMLVRRLKYLEKKEGFGKFISSAIWVTDLSVCLSSTLIRVMRARSIHSFAVVPLACMDDGAEVTLRQTHLIGIETNLVLLDGMLVDKIDEAVEDALFP